MKKIENKEIEMLEKFDDVLTVQEIRQILKIGKNYCYNLLKSGSISSIRIGKSYRVPKINLINYLKDIN